MTITIGTHPSYRAGKAVLFIDGQPTRHWVGAYLRNLRTMEREEFRSNWPDVTDEMIAAIEAYDWPAQCEPAVDADQVDLRCACGETTSFYMDQGEVTCDTCGRRYRVTVTVDGEVVGE